MKKISNIIHTILLIIISIIISASCLYKYLYPNDTFEEILFYLTNGVIYTDKKVFINFIIRCIPVFIIIFLLIFGLYHNILFNSKIILKVKYKRKKEKKYQLYPSKLCINHKIISTIILFAISLIIMFYNLGLFNYIKNQSNYSKLIEENYVDPKSTSITFEKKKNLILISVESLETTVLSKENGGKWNYEITPFLSNILKDEDSVYFYANENNHGMNMLYGADATTASLVTNSSGVTFKTTVSIEKKKSNKFLKGVYNLGDLLYDNGYYNELISSATTSFGGLKNYYTDHGKYKIIDINTYKRYDLSLSLNDKGSWGFNDKYLFDTAKKRLEEITKQNKPFNLTLLTIDTHFPDGYNGYYTLKKYNKKYENVYATESKLIEDFINYVKKQDYYKDTVIVIMGDHLAKQSTFFSSIDIKDRYVYNCYINTGFKNIDKTKQYSALDTYPTIVTALGGKIQGDKLGLGVNMFSNQKTLIDKYGLKYVNYELQKTSIYYNKNISKY